MNKTIKEREQIILDMLDRKNLIFVTKYYVLKFKLNQEPKTMNEAKNYKDDLLFLNKLRKKLFDEKFLNEKTQRLDFLLKKYILTKTLELKYNFPDLFKK